MRKGQKMTLEGRETIKRLRREGILARDREADIADLAIRLAVIDMQAWKQEAIIQGQVIESLMSRLKVAPAEKRLLLSSLRAEFTPEAS
jgi:hypothetical protein